MKRLVLAILILLMPLAANAQSVFIDRLGGLNTLASVAIKAPVRVATTGSNIALSGYQTIDGIFVTDNSGTTAVPDRVLVKDQSDQTQNGIYNVSAGAWSRSSDFNNSRSAVNGTWINVVQGTLNISTTFQLYTSDNPITFTSSTLVFSPNAIHSNIVRTLTGTSLTIDNSYGGVLLYTTNTATVTVTLPANLPVGFILTAVQGNSGRVTFSAGSGASVVNRQAYYKTVAQWSNAAAVVVTNPDGGSATWLVFGDLGA